MPACIIAYLRTCLSHLHFVTPSVFPKFYYYTLLAVSYARQQLIPSLWRPVVADREQSNTRTRAVNDYYLERLVRAGNLQPEVKTRVPHHRPGYTVLVVIFGHC